MGVLAARANRRSGTGTAYRQRGGMLLDALLFVIGLGCVAYLLLHVAVFPAARRALAKEREAQRLEREVERLAAEVERLRKEVIALQSDPWYIERTLKQRLRTLRPDLFRESASRASRLDTAAAPEHR